MPLDPLQKHIASLLKARRSANSFIGGSSVFNETFPRRSDDIDIYVEDRPIGEIAADDIAALQAAGLEVSSSDQFYGFAVEAVIRSGAEATKLEWTEADRRRFYPIQQSPTFGWTLHKSDLAVQKLVAAASRRAARDAVDVLLLDRFYAPLAALAMAAPAKLEGASPIAILERVLAGAIGQPIEDFKALRLDTDNMPFAIGDVKLVLADLVARTIDMLAIECAEAEPGLIYLAEGHLAPAIPRSADLERLARHSATKRGTVPIFSNAR